MQKPLEIDKIRQELAPTNLDGWLLYDFRRSNDIACDFLRIPQDRLLTRRFFYWIPKQGDPVKIVHAIESQSLSHLPGKTLIYITWQDLERLVLDTIKGAASIAMEYSPRNAIPYISKVDGGTLDLIRAGGAQVVSSADLLQKFMSVWDEPKLQSHLAAADVLDKIAAASWEYLGNSLRKDEVITEYDVQRFILKLMAENGCMTDSPPICAVNAHSADPHYTPTAQDAARICKGDFILIDLWCKQKKPNAVYADITRVGVAADTPSPLQQKIFDIVKRARDVATEFVVNRFKHREPVRGWEVDAVCRQVIEHEGFGKNFLHRTGHNIDTNDHGNGANIDNYETKDMRILLPGTCFSIEPGIYLPDEFGVRLEYDVYIYLDGTVRVTGGIQDFIVCV